jgi:hypothetical protein
METMKNNGVWCPDDCCHFQGIMFALDTNPVDYVILAHPVLSHLVQNYYVDFEMTAQTVLVIVVSYSKNFDYLILTYVTVLILRMGVYFSGLPCGFCIEYPIFIVKNINNSLLSILRRRFMADY